MSGGDLRFHIGKKKRFSEEQTRFMIACMIVGLEYMHNNGVIHRDIKPENIVMDEMGYVRITDLGIARIWTPENSQDTSGTPGYMGKKSFWPNSKISTRSYVSAKPLLRCGLFRHRSHRLRIHARKSKCQSSD